MSHQIERQKRVRVEAGVVSNVPLLVDVKDLWFEETSPVVRWLSRHYTLGVHPEFGKLRGNTGLFQALGIFSHHAPCRSMNTWSFILQRFPELRERCMGKDAFFPRQLEPWPLQHPALVDLPPFVWAGSYHPHQPKGSPLLEFDALDELTAWALHLTDTVDVEKVKLQLDMAMQVPGFRIWIDRMNILSLPVPMGTDATKVMHFRFEVLDSPLHYPMLKRGGCKNAFRWPVDLSTCPQFPIEGVPFSNGKIWPMLCTIPADRWTITTSIRYKRGQKAYQDCAPYQVARGNKTEVEVAGVFFKSFSAACLFFRVPYETAKSRIKTGKPLEAVLGLRPLQYQRNAGYVLGTTFVNHWNQQFMRVEDRK